MQIQKCVGLLLPVMMTCAGAEIVMQGNPCADIVISETADTGTVLAAKDLQKHLQLISGARLAIVTPQQAKARTLVCVGESSTSKKAGYKAPKFKTSGYDIWVKGNYIVLNGPVNRFSAPVIAGKLHPTSALQTITSTAGENKALKLHPADDNGPMHAVSAFLEHLGVRFYAPYKDGTVIPALKDIKVGDFRETREAAFARREYQLGAIQKTDAEAVLWFKRLKSGSALPPVGTLALADLLKANEKQHPEWAAKDENGDKFLTSDGCIHPRYAEKSLQQAILQAARQVFDNNPGLTSLLILPPALKAGGDVADFKRLATKKHYPEAVLQNIMTAAYAAIAEELAKTHPGKTIVWQGFAGKNMPDAAVSPANLAVTPQGQGSVFYANAKIRKDYIAQLPKFSRIFKVKTIEQREWWNEYSCPQAPRQTAIFPRALQEVRQAQRSVVSGVLMEAAVDSKTKKLAEVPLTHFMYYVNSKLLWDPELDLKKLTDEYCNLWFGPAAEEMKSFMLFAESISTRPLSRSITRINGQLTPTDIPMLFELLAKAKAKTADKTIYRKRVAALEKSLAGLKDIFKRSAPAGKKLSAEIFPYDQKMDANFGKYKKWYTFGKGSTRTEFALAFAENRARLFVAVRSFEPEMKKLQSPARTLDDCAIFGDDHIRIDFNTPNKSSFVFAANTSGAFLDGSSDPDELAAYGSFTARDREKSNAVVKKHADRWEAEFVIDLGACGKAPDWNPAWGFNISRVRTVSGKAETFSLVRNAVNNPSRWRQLVLPKLDSKGNETHRNNGYLMLHPGYKDESVYTVKRAKGKVELSDPWDEKSWKDIPELRLGWESWSYGRSSGFRPDARAKVQYDDKYIYVLYQVKDKNIRGTFKKDQEMVCLDSCMEFFVQPDPAGPYYNFECNCIGTLLLYEIHCIGDTKKMSPMPAADLQNIQRFSTLPRDIQGELKENVTWRLGLRIPIEMFASRTGVSADLSGQVWGANVYKCADWTATPAWLMWKKNYTFHNPEGFGRFIFE